MATTGCADIVIDKLKQSLFGNGGSSQFEAEAIARLDRIEKKLDGLIKYLRDKFPAVVAAIVNAADAEVTAKALKTEFIAVKGRRDQYLKNPTSKNAEKLCDACEGAWKLLPGVLDQLKLHIESCTHLRTACEKLVGLP